MGFFSKLLGLSENKKSSIKNEANIPDAINAHVKWKIRLEKYLDGSSEEKLDAAVICRDDQCALGKWIYGAAEIHFKGDEGLKILREDHAEFHTIAGKIVSCVQASDQKMAEALMKQDYAEASRKVIRDLTELDKQLS